ncbi:MAG: NAD(P)/FAD-dependent oxidoreductase [Campylobacterota bacterium]
MKKQPYDLIVIGSGAAGMMSAITAKNRCENILLIEQLPTLGSKLKATGGGRCNLSNTLDDLTFMNSFGKNGRFMRDALNLFNHNSLIDFLSSIGVETHIPDGFRIFPVTHNSSTIINALKDELNRLNIQVMCSTKVEELVYDENEIIGVKISNETINTQNVIVATGGLGYPMLGANGDGYDFASKLGHKITPLYPAMLPLKTKETWVASCRADTIAKACIKIDLPKAKKLKATGDLIFTSKGIRGPVVLDFAREITPFLEKYGEVPILVNLVKGMNENDIFAYLKKEIQKNPDKNVVETISSLLPNSVAKELALLAGANIEEKFNKQSGEVRNQIVKILAWTPLTVIGHDGFKKAMITRGGVSLKDINPKTMQSKHIKGLYFCGEVVDLDGPCGGYNLQWSFSSGYLAGHLKSE